MIDDDLRHKVFSENRTDRYQDLVRENSRLLQVQFALRALLEEADFLHLSTRVDEGEAVYVLSLRRRGKNEIRSGSDVLDLLLSMLSASKRCSRCGQEKALTEFPRRMDVADGRAAHCLQCEKIRKVPYNAARYNAASKKLSRAASTSVPSRVEVPQPQAEPPAQTSQVGNVEADAPHGNLCNLLAELPPSFPLASDVKECVSP